jgi:hypothetical protein
MIPDIKALARELVGDARLGTAAYDNALVSLKKAYAAAAAAERDACVAECKKLRADLMRQHNESTDDDDKRTIAAEAFGALQAERAIRAQSVPKSDTPESATPSAPEECEACDGAGTVRDKYECVTCAGTGEVATKQPAPPATTKQPEPAGPLTLEQRCNAVADGYRLTHSKRDLSAQIRALAIDFARDALREVVKIKNGEWWKSEGYVWRVVSAVAPEGPSSPAFIFPGGALEARDRIINAAIEAAAKGVRR